MHAPSSTGATRQPAPDRSLSEQEHGERLLELFEESVRLRLMSDVPLGAMLSGGIDSSLIVALMARNMTEPVKTFTVGFREAAGGERARRRASRRQVFGTEHHELELVLDDQRSTSRSWSGTWTSRLPISSRSASTR